MEEEKDITAMSHSHQHCQLPYMKEKKKNDTEEKTN